MSPRRPIRRRRALTRDCRLAAVIFPFVLVVVRFPCFLSLRARTDTPLLQYAVTGFSTDVQALAQIIGAGLVPGNARANLYFTLYGSNTVNQARGLTRDLKLGRESSALLVRDDGLTRSSAEYTKLPPRATFYVQTLGTIIGAILQLVIVSLARLHRRYYH